jgi:hypothetical protein
VEKYHRLTTAKAAKETGFNRADIFIKTPEWDKHYCLDEYTCGLLQS